MKLHLVTIGKPKLAYAVAGWQEYLGRLQHFHDVHVTPIPDKHNDASHIRAAIGRAYTIALIINGQPVPNIGSDGSFRYFTEPLDPGEHTIVIVGQNRRGGTAKQQVTIVVPK